MRKRFTAYSAARASALLSEGWFALALLPQRLKNMRPLQGIGPEILPSFSCGSSHFHSSLAVASRLIAQRIAVRHLLRVGLVQRLAKFAAVNFRVLPDLGLHFHWIVVPPLEMPGAQFSLGILLIAGALPGLAHFDLLFRRRGFRRRRSGCDSRSGRSSGSRRGRCCRWYALWCGLLGHSWFPLSGQVARSGSIRAYLFCILLEPIHTNQARLW
jgi:hypothetical protein